MHCLNCGQTLPDQSRFCNVCGSPQISKQGILPPIQSPPENTAEVPPQGGRERWSGFNRIISFGVFALVVLFVALLVVFSRKEPKQSNIKQVSAVAPTATATASPRTMEEIKRIYYAASLGQNLKDQGFQIKVTVLNDPGYRSIMLTDPTFNDVTVKRIKAIIQTELRKRNFTEVIFSNGPRAWTFPL